MATKTKIEDLLYSDIAYDDAFRTMETECDDLLLPFLNYAFNEKYDKTAKIIRLRNEHFIKSNDHSAEKRITDSHFEVEQNGITKRYHLECESSRYDDSILVRIFEYDAQIALDNAELKKGRLNVFFPHTGLLILRSTSKTPDSAEIFLDTPGGHISYEIPVIRISDFTIDDLFEKKLFLLIPFYIFNYEKELPKIDSDKTKIEELVESYRNIIEKLDCMHNDGILSSLTYGVIISLTHRVLHKLTMKQKSVQEKVGDIMGGKVIDLPILREYHKGIDEGKKVGKAEGIAEIIIRMFDNGTSEEEISRLTGISIDEVRSMIETGKELTPTT